MYVDCVVLSSFNYTAHIPNAKMVVPQFAFRTPKLFKYEWPIEMRIKYARGSQITLLSKWKILMEFSNRTLERYKAKKSHI